MKEKLTRIIKKAQRSLGSAKKLFEESEYDFAVSRAYYAMFYMAEAVLMTKELTFSKHSGVISAFNLHFVKDGIFDKQYQKMLTQSFKARNVGDYDYEEEIYREDAEEIIESAEAFLKETTEFLRKEKWI